MHQIHEKLHRKRKIKNKNRIQKTELLYNIIVKIYILDFYRLILFVCIPEGFLNKLTITLDKLIKDARLGFAMNQTELTKAAYFSQATISQVEKGKRNVTASEIIYLSNALNKPILYFYPSFYRNVDESKITPLEQELLI